MSSAVTLLVQLTKTISMSSCIKPECGVIIPVIIIHIVTDILCCVIFMIILIQNNKNLASCHWKYNPAYSQKMGFVEFAEIS